MLAVKLATSTQGGGYLECTVQAAMPMPPDADTAAAMLSSLEQVPEQDPAAAPVEDAASQGVSLCWHICYSPSYRVPVLYFAAHRPGDPEFVPCTCFESMCHALFPAKCPRSWHAGQGHAGIGVLDTAEVTLLDP